MERLLSGAIPWGDGARRGVPLDLQSLVTPSCREGDKRRLPERTGERAREREGERETRGSIVSLTAGCSVDVRVQGCSRYGSDPICQTLDEVRRLCAKRPRSAGAGAGVAGGHKRIPCMAMSFITPRLYGVEDKRDAPTALHVANMGPVFLASLNARHLFTSTSSSFLNH